jgi:tyrosyl-tRNA synthetase
MSEEHNNPLVNEQVDNQNDISDLEKEVDRKYNLITRNLDVKLGINKIKDIIRKRSPKVYFGTAPTGACHIAYLYPLLKLADYLDAGCELTILIADLHAMLDNLKSTPELVQFRTKYYEIMMQEMLKILNVDMSKVKFVTGSSFQLSKEYTMDVYKVNSFVTVAKAQHSGAEVVKQSSNPKMNSLLYPTLQALDQHYLNADFFAGGSDQVRICVHAKEILPKLGYDEGVHLLTGMVPGLSKVSAEELKKHKDEKKRLAKELRDKEEQEGQEGQDGQKENTVVEQDNELESEINKMSASDPNSKIDLLDTRNKIKAKINSAYCKHEDIIDNSPLTLAKMIVFPILTRLGKPFVINRKEQYGGKLEYIKYDDMENDFKSEKLHPEDMKLGLIDSINDFLEPIRQKFEQPEFKLILNQAYPPDVPIKTLNKDKTKNKPKK